MGKITRTEVPKIKRRPIEGKRNVIPKLKVGTLGGEDFFKKPITTRRRRYSFLAKRIGEKRVIGKLRAIQVLVKNINPIVSEKARRDALWVASSFIGKKRVKTGRGLSK